MHSRCDADTFEEDVLSRIGDDADDDEDDDDVLGYRH